MAELMRYARIKIDEGRWSWVRITGYDSSDLFQAEGRTLGLMAAGRGMHPYHKLAQRLESAGEGQEVEVNMGNIISVVPPKPSMYAAINTWAKRPDHHLQWAQKDCAPTGHGDEINPPQMYHSHVDPEPELVAMVDRYCHHITPEQAQEAIAFVTVGNDVCERRLEGMDYHDDQEGGGRILKGNQRSPAKSWPTSGPVGPFLISGVNTSDLNLRMRVDGDQRGVANTGNMAWTAAELVADASDQYMLEPGDLVFTGAPGYIGLSRAMAKPPEDPQYLKQGQVVSITLETSDGGVLVPLENRVGAPHESVFR